MNKKNKISKSKPAHQNQFGAVVRLTRGASSLRTFAQSVGVSHVQIRNWETGAQRPPVETLRRLYRGDETIRQMARLLLGLYVAEINSILGETKS